MFGLPNSVRVGLVFTAAILATGCGRSDLVGKWEGRTIFDESKARYPVTAADRARIEALASARETLIVEADGKFLWTSTGGPDGEVRIDGTWGEKEKTLTLVFKNRNGKPVEDALTGWRVYQIEPSRKRMTYDDPSKPEIRHTFERTP